ncbi:hypothetical protein LTR36_009964 [Oleoguttula mirabilis]|uniref:WW domain-containing protein n=1 Tax=Oleoguttula mirabilis TaxID=1507867 RepID=A0AAV9J4Z4_9PEZI|nr:hypothetical protein LTR36_009964 [Oleoguttula mirabilis]
MESPNKRFKAAHEQLESEFVALDVDEDEGGRYGYGEDSIPQNDTTVNAPSGPRAQHHRDARFDRRNAQDRPKSKHALPGYEPWVLVKTKFGRRFVHNVETKESFWHVPSDVWPAVKEFDAWEKAQTEKDANAKWAEDELQKMRDSSNAEVVNSKADGEESRSRRRRSESLQREDEEAMMAEMHAEAEHAEEQDAKQVLKTVEPEAGEFGYDSEGSFEYVEVTDSEGEEGDEKADQPADDEGEAPLQDEGPVEFGEDDIAYQLAAMGEDYGLDPGEYGDEPEEGWEEGAEGLAISDEDAANLFRDLLDDYRISPFTPWEKLIADESDTSIVHDDRYTVLPSMKARQDVWSQWAKDKAAQLKEERAQMEKKDPRIPYLAFLAEKATPKLYWPEFKRKYKRDSEMNDRKLSDKDRERLYRDHINRLKLPESTRKADLMVLLKSVPLRDLNNTTTLDTLPQQLLTHLHLISLLTAVRDKVVVQHIRTLASAPEIGDMSAELREEGERKRAEKRKREDALAARQRQVDEERRKAEKEERFAKRGLLEEERLVREATRNVGNRGLMAQLGGEGDG